MERINRVKPEINKRPPIVTIMGHVDHGKTSLLEALLETTLTSTEIGGITQRISSHSLVFEGRKLTFVDTPGHEAFLAMRQRGGQLADIILLVVAGSEGVRPQTQEAINHIKSTKAAVIVVLSKKDLPDFNADQAKRQLADNGILVEGYGGKTPVAEVSTKDKVSLKKLLELIILLSDITEYGGTNEDALEALVIESLLDRKKGPLALVVLRSGVLKVGQEIFCGESYGRIKSLTDESGRSFSALSSGEAAWILGFNKPPQVGSLVQFQEVSEASGTQKEATKRLGSGEKLPDSDGLKVIMKAESQGTLEAVESCLSKIASQGKSLSIVSTGVGDINNSDVYLAADTGSIICGFRVKVLGSAKELALERGVDITTYDIIYKLLSEVEQALLGLSRWQKRTAKPAAEILEIFPLPSGDLVLGFRLKNGAFRVGQAAVIKRGEDEIFKSTIKTLKIGKNKVEKIIAPSEGGVLLEQRLTEDQVAVGDELTII